MLGENIYNLRKTKKMSQEDLAEIIKVTRQTISNWELGETSPNTEQLKLLSKTLNVSIDELLNNDILIEKVNNTDKMINFGIKTLKILIIIFVIILLIDIISFIIFLIYNF